MKLKNLLFVFFLVFLIVPVLILGIVSMDYYKERMEKILENDLSVATITQIAAIDNFLTERERNLSSIASSPEVHRLLNHSNGMENTKLEKEQDPLENILKMRVSQNEDVVSISIVDRNFVVAGSSKSAHTGTISKLAKADKVYLDGSMHLTPVTESQSADERQKVLVAVKGVYEGEELIGYITEEICLSFFEKVRRAVNLFNDGTIYLIDDAQNVITAGNAFDSRSEFVLPTEEQVDFRRSWGERDRTTDHGTLRFKAQGEHYLSYYSQLENTGWLMISTVNTDQILQIREGLRILLIVVFALVLIFFILISYVFSSRFVKPLENMIKTFQQIRETQDYHTRMESFKSSEMGAIASEINMLLAGVEKHMDMELQKQRKLETQAERDALTGLYNKKTIEGLLRTKLEEAQKNDKRLACLFIDVDDFKAFNTKYGHLGGDDVLRFVAETIQQNCSLAGRMGGDEFIACIIDEMDSESLEEIINRILAMLHQGVILDPNEPPVAVRCSIGAAYFSQEIQTYEELLESSDMAMYRVKNTSKDSYCIWQEMSFSNRQ